MNLFIVGKYTFLEIFRSKIIYNVLLIGCVLLLVSFVTAEFTYGVPGKVALDFGLGSMALAAVGISLFFGSTLMHHEINNRTIYMALSRPVTRFSFLAGKILGLSGILFLNTLILSLFVLLIIVTHDLKADPLILWSFLFSFCESILVLLMVIFFSMLTNVTMTVLYGIGLYIVGHALTETLINNFTKGSAVIQGFVNAISYFIPNLSLFNLRDHVLYQQNVEVSILIHALLYFCGASVLLFFFSYLIFSRKNLD